MKRGAIVVALLLSGCMSSPVTGLYRPGSTFAERQRVADQCRIESLSKVPQVMVSEVTPGVYDEGILRCRPTSGGGQICHRVGVVNIPPRVTTRDVNDDLRQRFVANCVGSAGYALITRPVCDSSGAAANGYYAQRDNQAPDSQIACVAEDEKVLDGRVQ